MVQSPDAARAAAPSRVDAPARNTPPSLATGLSRSAAAGFLKIEIAGLQSDGSTYAAEATVPALPLFEGAVSAFGRGTLMQSTQGEIAVEDLRPGDLLCTATGRAARVMWIGTAGFCPQAAQGQQRSLVRIMPDSFGEGRPDTFLTLGPGARILQTPASLRGRSGPCGLLTPARQFVDSVNVVEVIPPTPVALFHIVLDRHAVIRAGGLECESFHPGADAARHLTEETRGPFLSLFRHVGHVADFGPLAHPRAPGPEVIDRD